MNKQIALKEKEAKEKTEKDALDSFLFQYHNARIGPSAPDEGVEL